jgi:hypothetical protein
MSQPDPAMYSRVFEHHAEGALILADLVERFGGNPYVRGGQEADRETAYRAGQNRVVQHILGRLNAASGAPDETEQDPAA